MPNSLFPVSDKQLVDYIMAPGAHQRSNIVKRILDGYKPFTDRYKDVRYPLRDYLLTQDFDNTLGIAKRRLMKRTQLADDKREVAILDQIDAIDLISSTALFQQIGTFRILLLKRNEKIHHFNGLNVRCSANIKLRSYKANRTETGLFMSLFKKNTTKKKQEDLQLRERRIELHSVLLQMHNEQMQKNNETSNYKLNLVHDVFRQTVHVSPKSNKRLRSEILACCRELSNALSKHYKAIDLALSTDAA